MRERLEMVHRLALLTVLMIGAWWSLGHGRRVEPVPLRASLETFPLALADWRGRDEPEFPPDVLTVLGVDEYLNRVYRRPGAAVGLYVGFYGSQQQGEAVHSPMNCLPGAGWIPVQSDPLTFPVRRAGTEETVTVRRYRVRRGGDEALVLYWYQSHGRVLASEYWSKAYMVLDALRSNRTDTALVRVVSMLPRGGEDASRVERESVEFVQAAFPALERHLPR